MASGHGGEGGVVITADEKVASVLARDVRLLEVFVAASPAFELLRNPFKRRTMAKLVTVAQAARIARVDPSVLLARLNAALGVQGEEPPSPSRAEAEPEAAPPGLLETPADRLVEVDVRDDLRAGREPLRRILDAAGALPPSHVLRLRATFEPVPLYSVLGRQGFIHFTERFADDDWRVWFTKAGAPTNAPPAPARAESVATDDVIIVDVRDLEPPEPLERTLEALATLPPGKMLVQINRRVPRFLLPKLEERGFTYEIREQSPELVRIFIHRP